MLQHTLLLNAAKPSFDLLQLDCLLQLDNINLTTTSLFHAFACLYCCKGICHCYVVLICKNYTMHQQMDNTSNADKVNGSICLHAMEHAEQTKAH